MIPAQWQSLVHAQRSGFVVDFGSNDLVVGSARPAECALHHGQ